MACLQLPLITESAETAVFSFEPATSAPAHVKEHLPGPFACNTSIQASAGKILLPFSLLHWGSCELKMVRGKWATAFMLEGGWETSQKK